MRLILLACLALCCLAGLTGCGSVDKSRVEATLATADRQAQQLRAFIASAAPQLDALAAFAAASDDPRIHTAAAQLASSVQAAQAALPAVEATLRDTRAQLATLEADAAGQVPWWSVAGGVLLAALPRVLGGIIPGSAPLVEAVANLAWNALATRRQKRADDLSPTPAKV